MKKPIEFTAARDKIQGEQYRYLQAAALIKLYREAHNGRETTNVQELGAWAAGTEHGSKPGGLDPFDILTREEIEATLAEFSKAR